MNENEQKQTKYSNGKIYKLVLNGCDVIYIGSTISCLRYRLCGHRRATKRRNSNVYSTMRHNVYDWKIIEIEKFPCNDRDELRAREQFWIDKLKPSLNSYNAAILNRKEYYAKRQKKWYEKNKECCRNYKVEAYNKKKDNKINCIHCDRLYHPQIFKIHETTKKHKMNILKYNEKQNILHSDIINN